MTKCSSIPRFVYVNAIYTSMHAACVFEMNGNLSILISYDVKSGQVCCMKLYKVFRPSFNFVPCNETWRVSVDAVVT